MKIYIARYQPERIGGGWGFMRNFAKAFESELSDYEKADIYFITSPSMIERSDVEQAKRDGKKIVLRLDNAVRNSRNRNTGMSRMLDFAQWADLVIYQSKWAKDYLMEYTHQDGAVILNSVDTGLYHPPQNEAHGDTILYSRFNRDETKNYEVARYWFSRYFHANPNSRLYIVGQFSKELIDGNFDFYNHEQFNFFSVLQPEDMANLYRNCNKLLYTYYNDACSNTLIEALVSGLQIVGDDYYLQSGGAPEIIEKFNSEGADYFSLNRMQDDYRKALESL